jgi:hypothetical protein
MRMKTHETEETELGFRVAWTGSGFMSSTPGAYGVSTSVRVARFSVEDVAFHCCVQPRSLLFLLFSRALNDDGMWLSLLRKTQRVEKYVCTLSAKCGALMCITYWCMCGTHNA